MENNPTKNDETLSEEDKLKLAADEKSRIEESERKKAAFLKFLDLDECAPGTAFFEIDYAGRQGMGRTVIALGNFAMHMRSIGHRKGKFHDPKLNIDIEGEQEFDVTIMTLRHHVSTVTLTRRLKEQNEIESLIEGVPQDSMVSANLIIHFSQGSFEVNNLNIELALQLRKVIYSWIISTY